MPTDIDPVRCFEKFGSMDVPESIFKNRPSNGVTVSLESSPPSLLNNEIASPARDTAAASVLRHTTSYNVIQIVFRFL
jgi:hypothetical protein